VIARQLQSSIV